MKTIAVLYGGKSGEHEVSLISAASIIKNLDPARYSILPIGITKAGQWLLQDGAALRRIVDGRSGMEGLPPIVSGTNVFVLPGIGLFSEKIPGSWEKLECNIVFPVLHGTFGEDGTVQGLLECAGLPYVGSGVLGSAVGMDKQVAKELWLREGLPVVEFITVRKNDLLHPHFLSALGRKIEARFGWPCFVKPASSGSSVGTSKVADEASLPQSLDKAFAYDEKVLIEEFIPAREVECAVLGNEDPRAFSPGEIIPVHEYYDYDAKYKDPEGATLQVPASLSETQEENLKAMAVKAYKACGFSGMARMDFFIDKRTGAILLNEANTIPGFTAISMYPRMCQAGGLSYPALLETLLDLGLKRFESRNKLSYNYDAEA
jgi:D-alanine-D-alanine ligase